MQEVGRIGTTVDLQFRIRRLHRSGHREHAAFGWQVVTLKQVTILAGRADIFPSRCSAARFRNHMVEGQFMGAMASAAILAGPAVAQKDVEAGKGRTRLGLNIFLQRDDARNFHLEAGGADDGVIDWQARHMKVACLFFGYGFRLWLRRRDWNWRTKWTTCICAA